MKPAVAEPTPVVTPSANPYRSRRTLRVSTAVVTLALAAGTFVTAAERATAGPEKFLLVYKAHQGQAKRTKSDATLSLDAGGQKVTFEFKGTSKVTFTEVDKAGNITFEDKTEEREIIVNGEKQDDEDSGKGDTDTVTLRPDGTLVAFKEVEGKPSEDEDGKPDTVHLSVRLTAATTPVFPAKEVGVGDTWSHEYKGDSDLGTRDAKADFEVLGFEKAGGVDCVKIKMTYAESGSGGISGKGTMLVERASGDKVSMDYSLEGVPFGPEGSPVTATGEVHEERTEGGPLTGGAAAVAADKDAKKDDPKKPGGDAKKDDKAAAATTPVAPKKDEEKKPEPKKEKTIDEVVKDYEKLPGVVTLFRKKESGKETIYAEIPEELLGKNLLLQATVGQGTAEQVVSGDPINDILFRFDKTPDDRVMMVEPNISYKATTPELQRALNRSFADGYLQSFKIEAKQADRKSLLIDVSELFRGDIAQISAAFQGGGGGLLGMPGGGGFGMDREKTYIKSIKNFPENLVVTTQYHFIRGGSRNASAALADPRSAPITVVYNLSRLPDGNGYVPRLADPRVGYFLTGYQSFDDDAKDDPLVRYIYRWDLKKKDPTAALSEPVKPVVFWLDNAIPTQYRDAVRDGLLMWNKAFEKVGFKDAVVVKQMPDNPDPNDPNTPSDTADMRFNCVRWVLSPESAYAVALFRVNPITGQILNASITVDAGIIRSFKLERKDVVDPAAAFARGAGADTDGVAGLLISGDGPLQQAARARLSGGAARIGDRFVSHDPKYCQFGGDNFRQQAWFGYNALSLLGPSDFAALGWADAKAAGRRNPLVNEKEYAEQIIRETVGHEFGHILGLRHNFAASTQFSLDQLKDAKLVAANGIGASVMDYNPFNIAALRSPGTTFFSQTPGTYDYWAVEYGYRPAAADVKKPEDEVYALRQVAKRSGLPGLAWQSDEQAFVGFDPKVMQYDLSSDPLAYWQTTIQVSRQLLNNLDKRLPRSGESYYEFTKAYGQLLGLYSGAAGVASRYVGGLNVSRTHKGDTGEKPALSPVDVAKQKQALALLNQYIFSPNALGFPDSYFAKLTTDPYGETALPSDFPVREQLSRIQTTALGRLFSGAVLTRVANNEFKMGGDPAKCLTLPALFKSVDGSVWAEAATKQKVSPLRRQLQRSHLDRMIEMALRPGGGVPEDARMLAWTELRSLKGRLAAAKAAPALDEYTRLHFTDSLDKVTRTLAAQTTLGGGAAPAAPNLLQMLLGGKEGGNSAGGDGATAAPSLPAPSGN